MARGTRTVYPGERNKGLSSIFQPPEEGGSVQRPKRCDKHGDKDKYSSPKTVNNVHNTSSQKYRQILGNESSDKSCKTVTFKNKEILNHIEDHYFYAESIVF